MPLVTARRADSAVTRKGRPGTGRPLANLIITGDQDLSIKAARVQFLRSRTLIDAHRAELIASLIWGDAA